MTTCPTPQRSASPQSPPDGQPQPLHVDPRRGKTFWEPAAPIAEAWSVLGPRISSRAQTLAGTLGANVALSIHMVMIGDSSAAATPNILFCVDHDALQQTIRHDSVLNNILTAYPLPIGVDFCPNLPQFLAGDASPVGLPPDDAPAGSNIPYGVWAMGTKPQIGTRLHVKCRYGGPPRMSTAGPVFLHSGKTYQTTVRHVFFRPENPLPEHNEPSFQGDLDMDDSDSDSDMDSGDVEASHHDNRSSMDGETFYDAAPDGLSRDDPDVTSTIQSPPSLAGDDESGSTRPSGKGKDLEIPRGACYLGDALLETVEGRQRAVDCALVEVRVGVDDDPNLVSYDPSDSTKKVRVTRPADMTRTPPSGTPVIVATSSRPVSGRVYRTLAYIKPQHQREMVAVYPLRLDEGMSLEVGDCGSVVIRLRGSEVDMYGHVVFGHPNTHLAYILPMKDIVNDIAQVLRLPPGERVSLHPGPESRQAPRYDGGTRIEFASPRFYKDMGEEAMPEKHFVRGLFDKLADKIANKRARLKIGRNKNDVVNVGTQASFKNLFFSLPLELRDQVIEYLDFRDAMNLRHVSREFREAVSVSGSAISKRFLLSNPLPPLARRLYPHASPDLAHIHRVGHYHAVAWRLADHIVQWLRRDMFLFESRFQRQQFQPKKVQMKQRLLPSLLLLGRFFERCRDSLEDQVREDVGDIGDSDREGPLAFSFEREIMEDCDDELLLQAQDVVLILVTFLRRTMRPNSKYGSVERTLRHGLLKPPSDAEIAAVLYHGGLEAMVKILDLEALGKKAAAVRAYCLSPPQRNERPLAQLLSESRGGSADGSDGPESGESGSIIPQIDRPVELQSLLARLPSLDGIWRPSGEAILTERGLIRRPGELNSFAAVLRELIVERETSADALYKQGHDLWHALSDSESRRKVHLRPISEG